MFHSSRAWGDKPSWVSPASLCHQTLLKMVFVALPILLATSLASAQDADIPTPIIRAEVEVVQILSTVRDRRGNYLVDLTRDDFEVYEDGARQEIQYFSFQSDDSAEPLAIALLIDTSGSVKDQLSFLQQAAAEFLSQTLRPEWDLAAVVQFDSDIRLVQDFTFDFGRLEAAVDELAAGGTTKLYDAIWLAAGDMLAQETGRRVMVVLSDGEDTQSMLSDQDAIRKAQENDVAIYGIGVRSAGFTADFRQLRRFAEATGGLFFNSRMELGQLRSVFSQINRELKHQYSLGYVSNNRERDGTFRKIEVRAKRSGLKVTHRKGYYASQPAQ